MKPGLKEREALMAINALLMRLTCDDPLSILERIEAVIDEALTKDNWVPESVNRVDAWMGVSAHPRLPTSPAIEGVPEGRTTQVEGEAA